MTSFANVPFDQITVGQSLTVSRTISRTDIDSLALVSGDIDEASLEQDFGPDCYTPSIESVAAEVFFSYLLNRRLPGPGTTILAHDLRFNGRIVMGDELSATITVKEKQPEGNVLVLSLIHI